jgi:tRNA nucleotidyltransferase/poly(A) polymerase
MSKFYRVGGCVRDKILNRPCKDVDWVVEGVKSFDEFRTLIAGMGGEIYVEKPEFLTIRARVHPYGTADYAMCRADGIYTDGRRPDSVTSCSLERDLVRRDFTMNAMAEDEEGNIIDLFHGQDHINSKIIMCVGEAADRFKEDSLRMLRAIRFSITLGMLISYDIEECLHRDEFIQLLDNVSAERISEELRKCFAHDTKKTLNYLMHIFDGIGNKVFEKNIWLNPTIIHNAQNTKK